MQCAERSDIVIRSWQMLIVEWPPSLEDHGMGVGSAVVVGGWVELSQQILKKLQDSYVLLFDNFLTSRLCRFVAKSITLAQHWPTRPLGPF